ncbi:hypothetical protein BDN71DRAFT_1451463, partial [Pleurotus eryngii]
MNADCKSASPGFATFFVPVPTSHLRKGDYAIPRYMTCSVARDASKNREERISRTCRLLFGMFGAKDVPIVWESTQFTTLGLARSLRRQEEKRTKWPADFTHFRARSKLSASRAECEPNEGDHEERTSELANPSLSVKGFMAVGYLNRWNLECISTRLRSGRRHPMLLTSAYGLSAF